MWTCCKAETYTKRLGAAPHARLRRDPRYHISMEARIGDSGLATCTSDSTPSCSVTRAAARAAATRAAAHAIAARTAATASAARAAA